MRTGLWKNPIRRGSTGSTSGRSALARAAPAIGWSTRMAATPCSSVGVVRTRGPSTLAVPATTATIFLSEPAARMRE